MMNHYKDILFVRLFDEWNTTFENKISSHESNILNSSSSRQKVGLVSDS